MRFASDHSLDIGFRDHSNNLEKSNEIKDEYKITVYCTHEVYILPKKKKTLKICKVWTELTIK